MYLGASRNSSTKKIGSKPLPLDLGESFSGSNNQRDDTKAGSAATPEGRGSTLETEDQPSQLHLEPAQGSLGGGPEPSVSSPDDEEIILQHEEQEKKRMAKQLAEEAKRALVLAEERRKAEEKALAEEKRKAEEEERAKQQAHALAMQRKEEEKRQEKENQLRQQQIQYLLKEKERIRQERKLVLTTQLALLIQRKKDLRKDLLNRRDEQLSAGQETDEIRQGRREELQMIYKEYAQKVVSPILEYWDIDDHTPKTACTIPVEDLEDYDVSYKASLKWNERELMKLRFNLEEVKLEPRYWEMAQSIHNIMYPEEVGETRRTYERIKQEWEQKYAMGTQWQAIAKSAI